MNSTSDAESGELTDQEIEDLTLALPVNERRLITSSADFSVGTLVEMLRDETLVVPAFQRRYVWSDKKASRLVESLIIQCPIPVLYLNRRQDEVLEVVDGNQRVASLRRFVNGQFALTGLTTYPELDGYEYDGLDQKLKRQIKNRTIRCVIIEPESNPQVKFDVFERLNSGSTPLTPQELRHGLYTGQLTNLLLLLSNDANFISMTGMKNDKRMRKDELVLRFLAFSNNLNNYRKPLSTFLTNFLHDNRDPPANIGGGWALAFSGVIRKLHHVFGPTAFRFRGGANATDPKKFNTAYFDAVSVGFWRSDKRDWPEADLANHRDALAAAMSELEDDNTFRNQTLRATSDEAALQGRIEAVREKFDAVV